MRLMVTSEGFDSGSSTLSPRHDGRRSMTTTPGILRRLGFAQAAICSSRRCDRVPLLFLTLPLPLLHALRCYLLSLHSQVILTKDDEAVGIDLACGQMSGVREEGFAGTALGSSSASEGTRPSPTGKKEETVIVAMDIDDNSTDQPWACHACTLENPSHLKACQACDTASGLAKHGVSL